MATSNGSKLETLDPVSNAAEEIISLGEPYSVRAVITGVAPLLFHAWNNEAVSEKAKSNKGSAAKKSDAVESYVYRNDAGEICVPGLYFIQSIIGAGRFVQDPRSPRKSAMELFKAGIIATTEYCSLGSKEWDYLDRRRVSIMRAGITRERPAFRKGWSCTCDFEVLVPEYIAPDFLLGVLTNAGRLIGIADYRPTYGRYQVTSFEVLTVAM